MLPAPVQLTPLGLADLHCPGHDRGGLAAAYPSLSTKALEPSHTVTETPAQVHEGLSLSPRHARVTRSPAILSASCSSNLAPCLLLPTCLPGAAPTAPGGLGSPCQPPGEKSKRLRQGHRAPRGCLCLAIFSVPSQAPGQHCCPGNLRQTHFSGDPWAHKEGEHSQGRSGTRSRGWGTPSGPSVTQEVKSKVLLAS